MKEWTMADNEALGAKIRQLIDLPNWSLGLAVRGIIIQKEGGNDKINMEECICNMFLNGRDPYPEEVHALRNYYKERYKK